ncbi:MAG: hypothetical protein ABIB61_00475 [Candidatus Shapirobacteria bacterium]
MKRKIVFFLCLVIIAFVFYWFKAIAPQLWSSQRQYNLVLLGTKDLVLLSCDPVNETSFFVSFPLDLSVESFGQYGEFKISKLTGLALQEKEPGIVPKTIEYNFGLAVDLWVSHNQDWVGDRLGFVRGQLNKLAILGKHLSFSERINLLKVSRFLGQGHLVWESKEGQREFSTKEGEILKLNQETWDTWASVYLADPVLKKEKIPIAIYNTTSVEGWGGKLERVLTNMGMSVVVVKDSSREEESCLLGLDSASQKGSWTYKRLVNVISPCREQVLSGDEFKDPTQINIYLGENFFQIR